MNCDEIKALLIEDIDNETSPEEHKEIQEHLISCKSCEQEYKDSKVLLNRIKDDGVSMQSNAEAIEKALDRQIMADLLNEVKELKLEVTALKSEIKQLRSRPLVTIPLQKMGSNEVNPKLPSTHTIERQTDPWILMRS